VFAYLINMELVMFEDWNTYDWIVFIIISIVTTLISMIWEKGSEKPRK